MGLDDTVNLERVAGALEKLARAFDQYNILYQRELSLKFPGEKPKRAPEVIANAESERRAEYSDQANAAWMRETEAAIPEASRFRERFNQTEASRREAAPRRRRSVEVPEVH